VYQKELFFTFLRKTRSSTAVDACLDTCENGVFYRQRSDRIIKTMKNSVISLKSA